MHAHAHAHAQCTQHTPTHSSYIHTHMLHTHTVGNSSRSNVVSPVTPVSISSKPDYIASSSKPQNLPLFSTFLVNLPPDFVPVMIAFNYAVWRFRKPAHASRLEESHDWLIRKLVGCANVILHRLKPPERKRKKSSTPAILTPKRLSMTLLPPIF